MTARTRSWTCFALDDQSIRPSSGVPAPELRRARLVLRHARGPAGFELGKPPRQDAHGRRRDAALDFERRVVGSDRHGLLVHDVARVRARRHHVERGARLRLALQHGPVDRRPAAILRQQRAVDVEAPRAGTRSIASGRRLR